MGRQCIDRGFLGRPGTFVLSLVILIFYSEILRSVSIDLLSKHNGFILFDSALPFCFSLTSVREVSAYTR